MRLLQILLILLLHVLLIGLHFWDGSCVCLCDWRKILEHSLHPNLHSIVASVSFEHDSLKSLGVGFHVNKSRVALNTVLLGHLVDGCSVDLHESNFVCSILFGDVVDQLIPVLLEIVAPVASGHVEVNENVFVFERGVIVCDQFFEL